MILRKPYAFLIKNFRIIHGIIFIILLYLLTKSISIYSFFNDYAVKHYFTPIANLKENYINIYMYVSIIILFIFSLIVYYLLSIKKKTRKLYFFICFYYILLFIYFIYIGNIFNGLDDTILSTETVRVIRDIGLISIIPQIFFSIIILLRTLGFNLKQFEFKSDLEDLQIDESDYEEVELTLGKNNYKYSRFLRKTLRYLKYFILENKFLVTIIVSLFIVGISTLFYINVKIENVSIYENENVFVNNLWYTVEKSYYTNTDFAGNIINDNKQYVIVKVKIENKSLNKYDLSRELFRLEVNNKNLLPAFSIENKFIDIGNIYAPMTINKESIEEVNIIFEIDNINLKNEYIFKIKTNENSNISKDTSLYKEIVIKPTNLNSEIKVNNYSIPASINFNESLLKESILNINEYNLANNFKEKYSQCINNNCYDNIVIVSADSINNAVLKLKTNLTIDENTSLKKYIINSSDLIEYYGTIKYRYLGNNYESKLVKIMNKKLNNEYSYFEIPNKILEADKIELVLNIRGKTYTIILK